VNIHDIPDGRAPAHWEQIRDRFQEVRRCSNPTVVFCPHRGDAHQDHRLLAELLPTEFRDHLILGYEILKWETDTPRPTAFHPLAIDVAMKKARLLHKHYPFQAAHDCFNEEAFLGLSRLRGVQCRSAHAEAFVMEKAALTFGGC
jgi:LmbE family N-acetylglucosaminyl deacetylase